MNVTKEEAAQHASLADRCSYFYRGRQCDARRVEGSTRCAIHDGGRRYAKAAA